MGGTKKMPPGADILYGLDSKRILVDLYRYVRPPSSHPAAWVIRLA